MNKPLRIMIVDDVPQRSMAVRTALEALGHCVVGEVPASDYLPARVRELTPDVILIDADAPGRDTLEDIRMANQDSQLPVVMFTGEIDDQTIYQAVRAGVAIYPIGFLAQSDIQVVIQTAIAQFEHHRRLSRERDRARGDLADRQLLSQAKQLLMDRHGITEPQAHRMLQKMAMDGKKRIINVARRVLDGPAPQDNA
jgi:response regulator NasT